MTGTGAAPPPAWLLDPDDPSLLRWWDGTGWTGFCQPRETPPPPPGPAAPGQWATAWTPEPPWTPPAAAPTAFAPTVFTGQWDASVLATLRALDPATAAARSAVHTEVRGAVLAAAAPDEEVLGVYAIAVHDPHERVDRLGNLRAGGDLFVTDRRLLVVGHWLPEGTPAFVTRDLDDVLLVTGFQRTAVRVDFDDDTLLVLRALAPAAYTDLLAVLEVVTTDDD